MGHNDEVRAEWSIASALDGVGGALEEALQSVRRLEHACLALAAGGPGAADAAAALQEFDLLAQSLDGVRGFVDALARRPEAAAPVCLREAASALTLGRLQARLTGAPAPEAATSGELELF